MNVIQMRPSRVLRVLRAGQTAFSVKMNLADPRVGELAARLAGVDCIWLDMEHTANDWSMIQSFIWAAKSYDVDVLVRVSRGGYSDYIRPLELDASGVMIPHVMSEEDADELVYYTKFHPIGRRPLDGGNADGAYGNIPLLSYMKSANEQRFNVLQIEDVEPLEELERIIAMPGVDMVFFGPGDFSQSIGAPGDWTHDMLAAVRQQIAELAKRHGKFAGTVGSKENYGELERMGYRFINLGADVVGLSDYFRTLRVDPAGSDRASGLYSSKE